MNGITSEEFVFLKNAVNGEHLHKFLAVLREEEKKG